MENFDGSRLLELYSVVKKFSGILLSYLRILSYMAGSQTSYLGFGDPLEDGSK